MSTSEKRPHMCGWCIAGEHDACRGEVAWYGVTWICACPHDVEEQEAGRELLAELEIDRQLEEKQ